MTKHTMTGAERIKIIEALKKTPNAAVVARQFDFGETTILRLCKKEGIRLQHLLTKAERTEVVNLLKTNLNALATAKQLGVDRKTVLAIAKEERIDIKAMRQAAKGKKTPPFTQWARGPGGKPVLQCAVYRNGGRRLTFSLNTADTEVEAPQRMRLILSRAIAVGQLSAKHPAWSSYGGQIPQSTKRLLKRLAGLPWVKYEVQRKEAAARLGLHVKAVDWLANQDKARQTDPVMRARDRTLARSRARKVGKRTPISRSWQYGALGGMLAVHSDGHPIYAQLTIAGLTLRWRLTVQNRAEAEAFVDPAIDARARVREAARAWRQCLVGSLEAKTALTTVLREQRLFRDALRVIGATRSKGWAEVVKALKEPPLDESSKPDPEGCTRWFVELLLKNPERPPLGRPVEMLVKEADALFRVGGRRARRCYEFAQEKTANKNWSTTRRPQKSA